MTQTRLREWGHLLKKILSGEKLAWDFAFYRGLKRSKKRCKLRRTVRKSQSCLEFYYLTKKFYLLVYWLLNGFIEIF